MVTEETVRLTVEASSLPVLVVSSTVIPLWMTEADMLLLSPSGRSTLCWKLLPPLTIVVVTVKELLQLPEVQTTQVDATPVDPTYPM